MNEWGNSQENIFSTYGTGDPSIMNVNYESKKSHMEIDKDKNKGMKFDTFPHMEGKHDFQYCSFSVGAYTKINSGL